VTVFPAGHVEPPGIQVLGEAMSEAKSKSLAALTSRVAAFEVPATGQTVILRRWSATERQTFQRLVKAQPDGEPLPDLYEQLLIRSLSDEGGNRLLTDDDLPIVRELDGLALEQIAKEVIARNGLGDDPGKAPSPPSRN